MDLGLDFRQNTVYLPKVWIEGRVLRSKPVMSENRLLMQPFRVRDTGQRGPAGQLWQRPIRLLALNRIKGLPFL